MNPDDTKFVLKSAGVWSGIATLLGTLCHILGYHIADADISAIVSDLSDIVTAISGLATIYFRYKAEKKLTLKPNGA